MDLAIYFRAYYRIVTVSNATLQSVFVHTINCYSLSCHLARGSLLNALTERQALFRYRHLS